MLDVDNFKQVNDELGHLKGDEVLRELASTIAEVAGQDNAYRYGGDEFSILLPGSDHDKTGEMAKRVLDAVKTSMNGENVTVSMGVAAYPEMAANAEELVYRADMALNWAKSSGKNQVGDWHTLIGRKADTEGPLSRAQATVDPEQPRLGHARSTRKAHRTRWAFLLFQARVSETTDPGAAPLAPLVSPYSTSAMPIVNF